MLDTIAKLEKALQRYPRVPLFARVADHYLKRGKVTRALALCQEGCERFPAYPTGHSVLSRCYEAQGEFEEARASLDRALRLDSDNAGGFVRLSHIYTRLGVPTLALKSIQQAAVLDPFSDEIAAEVARLNRSLPPKTVAEAAAMARDSDAAAATSPAEAPPEHAVQEAVADEEGPAAGEVGATVEPAPAHDAGGEEAEALEMELPKQSDTLGQGDAAAETGAATELYAAAEESAEEADPAVDDESVEARVGDLVDAEPRGAFAVPAELEPGDMDGPGAEADLQTLVDAVDDDEHADEPFAQVKPLPEWDEAPVESVAPPAAPVEESSDTPAPPRPVVKPVSAPFDNEVAALGAGLFDDEETAPPPADPAIEEAGETDALEAESVEEMAPAGLDDTPIPAETMTPAEAAEAASQSAPAAGPEEAAAQSDPPTADEPAASAASAPVSGASVPVGVSRLSRTADDDLLEVFREIEPTAADVRVDRGMTIEPMPTATLAELYTGQGFAERAAETYKRILRDDPRNEAVAAKLAELSRTTRTP